MPLDIRTERLPAPHDLAWAEAQTTIGLAELRRELGRAANPTGIDEVAYRSLLMSVFGNSPFLGQCLLREMPTLARV